MVTLALALQLALSSTGATATASATPIPTSTSTPTATPTATSTSSPTADALGVAGPSLTLVPPESPPPLRSMTLIPQELDPGPFRPGELAGATLGAFTGDAIVLGSGYWALQMFARGTIEPTAAHFRHAIYALGAGALLVPPLTAVLFAKLAGGRTARYGFWKALALASLGEVAALAAGYYAAPRFWVVLPVQAVAISLGASFGLHWGSHTRAAEPPPAPTEDGREAATRPAAPTAGLALVPLCTEG